MAGIYLNKSSFAIDWQWEKLETPKQSQKSRVTTTSNPLKRKAVAGPDSEDPALKKICLEPPLSANPLLSPPVTHPLATRFIQEDVMLGQGAEGWVMRGKNQESGCPVALKIHYQWFGILPAIQEAAILRQLAETHTSHRLQIHADFCRSQEEHVIVTDLVPEKNIHQAFISPEAPYSSLTFSEIITIARQSLEFLSSLQSQGLKHTDLRIDNLIFERNSRYLTILDYRRCRTDMLFPFDHHLQVLWQRTPEEVLRGALTTSHDIWTLGCILFELFTRTKLFPITPKKDGTDEKRLIQLMVQQIGIPSKDFLSRTCKAPLFFNYHDTGSVELLENPRRTTRDWKEAIRKHGKSKKCSQKQIKEFLDLLENMVRWENRLSPQELLKSPLFHVDVKFHLSPDFTSEDFIFLYHHTQQFEPHSKPILEIDLRDHVTRTCFHLPRNPEDSYYLVVYRNQELIFNQLVQIQEETTLSMSPSTLEA